MRFAIVCVGVLLLCGCRSRLEIGVQSGPKTPETKHQVVCPKECCKPDAKDAPKRVCGCPNCGNCPETKKCLCDPVNCMDKNGCAFDCLGK